MRVIICGRYVVRQRPWICFILVVAGIVLLYGSSNSFGGKTRATQNSINHGSITTDSHREHESLSIGAVDKDYPADVRRYCNYPLYNDSQNRLFGHIGDSAVKLRALLILTRHGDRAPLTSLPAHLDTPRCGLWETSDIELTHEFRMALSNGPKLDARASQLLNGFEKMPVNERCRPGHLTAVGAVQMLRLGRRLSTYYRSSWNFDLRTATVRATTTAYPRTYQSALAFLYGWTDSGRERPFDSLTLTASDNVQLCTEAWCKCTGKLDGLLRDYHKSLADQMRTRLKTKNLESIFKQIGRVLELPKLEDPVAAFDALSGYACHGEAMPCNVNLSPSLCVNKTWMSRMLSESAACNRAPETVQIARKLAVVEAMPTLWRLAKLVQEVTASASKTVFEYLSAHDVTIWPVLSALGLFDGTIPPFASHLTFELLLVNNNSLYYRVLHNADDLTSKVSETICVDSFYSRYGDAVFKLCNVNGLLDYVKRFVDIHRDNGLMNDWNELCS